MPTNLVHADPFGKAITLQQQGRLKEAEAAFAHILATQPGNVGARYYQALIWLQQGKHENAIAAFKKLLKQAPNHPDAHFSLGLAYLESGRPAVSLPHFQRVVALAPKTPEGYFYVGLSLAQQHRQQEALPAFKKAIELQPDLTEAHLNLGNALSEMGRHEEARACFQRALELNPQLAESHNGLGNSFRGLGKTDQAIACFQKAIALRPNYAEPYQGLGMALNDLGKFDEAVQHFKQAILLKPDFVVAFTGWGRALQEMGQIKAARACWEKALELEPKQVGAYIGLGQQHRALAEHSDALANFQKALRLDSKNAEACSYLGGELFSWGRCDEGVAYLEKALALAPDVPEHHSGLLFNLHYHAPVPAERLADYHRAFGERFEASLKPLWRPHDNSKDPERGLRVGLISGDFRRHPVGYFMADLLESLKANGLELYAYANHWHDDDLTERIKPQFAGWCKCKTLSDDALAERIRADGIDVLVDLSGHTEGMRLLTFARKPAPVQVTYLGYPDTTGLTAIDYILGDPRMFPPEEAALYTEKPWHLPDTSLCYMPPDQPVEVGPLPALQNGGTLTFGCLNKREKISDAAIEVWAEILRELPDSRLLLQNKVFADAGIAEDMRKRFAAKGVAQERLELIGGLSWREHLETYNRVDIALDPFPYNGTTTSVEGLWVGVPLLALKGDRLVAHMGESIQHAMGMTEWIAADKHEYVAKAVAFAGDLPALAAVRNGLRERLLASPICDAPRFARNLEAAFRGMWREWCAKQ